MAILSTVSTQGTESSSENIGGFLKLGGILFGGPYNKDSRILRSIISGAPLFWETTIIIKHKPR